jgi:2-polyprenyl-6-hydroxyphenyl methylase / 3-demethylubiquinone-9 3-methyltransferase
MAKFAKLKTPRALKTLETLAHTLRRPPPVGQIEPSYHAVREGEVLKLVAKHLGKNPSYPGVLLGQHLLDVGCGTAPLGCYFMLAGADVTAIDPNRQALAAAAKYAESFGTPLNFLPVKAEDLLASGVRFQIILALDVLAEHPSAGKLIWVLRQLLAPGGVLILGHTTRSLRAWFIHRFFSQILFQRVPQDARGWQHFHTPAQLNDLAEAAGLQPIGHTLLRYSLNGGKWKATANRRIFTRYLAAYTA